MAEERQRQKILVAPAWPYAAGKRHLGHVVGFAVPADIFARYQRLKGNDVLMVSGTDEHGTPVMVTADRESVSPHEIAERYNKLIREDLRDLGISYDCFTRTTTQNHARVTTDFFRTLYEHGCLIEKTTLGAFSASTGNTLPDRYIEGTCPICGYTEARGDQCDNCGNQLDPTDLINPRSIIDGSTPEFRETKHLFLDLPQFADRLRPWIESKTSWRANVRNFSLSLVGNLKPRAMTRDIDWGIPVPVEGYPPETKRIYVWFDAVIGYLSAAVEWARNRGDAEAWREWWQNPDSAHAYFMGKDNIVFHTVIWPSMLLGYGEGGELGAGKGELHLPDDVVASEFLTMEGKQLSTSRAVAIYVRDVLERYDPDPVRYFLTAAGPETQDSDFSWAEFLRRNNDELLANWGNLVNRTLTNAYRNFSEVPTPGELTEEDRQTLAAIESGFGVVGRSIAESKFKQALAEAMRLSSLGNQYVDHQAPWAVIKEDRERAATILYVALRVVDSLKVLFTPFLPFSSQKLHELLGYEGWLAGPLEFREIEEDDGEKHTILTGDYSTWVGRWEPSELRAGQRLREPEPLFRKLDPEIVEEELTRLTSA
ncbi:MAG: methionine--tRNA ligase [Actinobacteria bacterium]|nr:MAG: methionine--tRNA ligase [Actinomycetota bacterium]